MKTFALFVKKNNQYMTVGKLCKKTVKLCKLSSATRAEFSQEQANIAMAKLQANGYEAAMTDFYDAKIALEMTAHPVCKAYEDSAFAKDFDIKPWHHLHFFGKYIYVVIWDSRVIDKVIELDKLDDKYRNDLHFIWDDLGRYMYKDTEQKRLYGNDIALHLLTKLSDYQMQKIADNSVLPNGCKVDIQASCKRVIEALNLDPKTLMTCK